VKNLNFVIPTKFSENANLLKKIQKMKGKKLRSIDEILDTPNYLANISKLA
jgi:hypothetical protein